MARTAVATLQTIWDCRWSRPGIRLFGVAPGQQPEAPWICTRTTEPRPVTEAECERCAHWELAAAGEP